MLLTVRWMVLILRVQAILRLSGRMRERGDAFEVQLRRVCKARVPW